MNPPSVVGAVHAEQPLPPVSTTFLVVTFGAAIVVGALVAYLGMSGMIGGPIP